MSAQAHKLTLNLRPLVMASVKQEAARWGMPPDEFVESVLTTARMHPEGLLLKLPDPPPAAVATVEQELPLA